jgi:hypothetical protein
MQLHEIELLKQSGRRFVTESYRSEIALNVPKAERRSRLLGGQQSTQAAVGSRNAWKASA